MAKRVKEAFTNGVAPTSFKLFGGGQSTDPTGEKNKNSGKGSRRYLDYLQEQRKKENGSEDVANEEEGINFGDVPRAAPYEPVDITKSLLDSITGNLQALESADDLTSDINDRLTAQSLKRIRALYPDYDRTVAQLGSNAFALSRGELPFEDVLGIVSNRAELTNVLGTPGTGREATLKDLGLSRLDAMGQGASLFQQIVQTADAIDPVSRQSKISDFLISPESRLQADILQAQLKQQSDQNIAVLEAQADPDNIIGALMAAVGGVA